MTYRKPGVEVVQEFQALTPALVLPTLPVCVVGPAYHVQDYTDAGDYNGLQVALPYPGQYAGSQVDVRTHDTAELDAIQKSVCIQAKNAYVTYASGADGNCSTGDQTFTAASNPFTNITLSSSVEYYVYIQNEPPNTDNGKHRITVKNGNNSVELADVMKNTKADNTYKVVRKVTSITYDNSTFTDMGITYTTTAVTVPADLPYDPTDATSYPICEADIYISYRALRPDLADTLSVYTDLTSLEAVFGVGNVVPSNLYAYGVNVALNNTTTEVNATGLRTTYFADESGSFQTALEFLETKDVYAIVILTQTPAIHQLLSTHVTGQSASSVGHERIGFINRKLLTYTVEVPSSGVGTATSAGADNGTKAAHVNTTFKDPTNGTFLTDGVTPGMYLEIVSYTAEAGTVRSIGADVGDSITAPHTVHMVNGAFTNADIGRTLTIAGSGNGNNGDKTIATIVGTTEVTVTETLASEGTGFTATVKELAPSAAQATFITTTRHLIDSVDSNTQLTLHSDPTNGFWGSLGAVHYRVTDDMTVAEQASYLAGYATAFANRRLISVWPDQAVASVGGVATTLPGYFAGCALGGLVAGLPSQQGLTNLSLTGFTGKVHSNDLFSDTQLNTIAGGGNLILVQDVAEAPIYVRHQLTTDTSTIQYQELSVTKNVDLVARFFRRLYQPFIGKYNITDALMDLLKTITMAGIDFLKNSKAPRVGGVLRDGSIATMAESADQPDTVEIKIDINIPYPLNNIKVTLLV